MLQVTKLCAFNGRGYFNLKNDYLKNFAKAIT